MSKANKGIFVVGGLVTAIGLAFYPVAVHPKLFPQKYRKYWKLKSQPMFYTCKIDLLICQVYI